MPVYATEEIDRFVAIDVAHGVLIAGLVGAHKPRRVLEIGFGSGKSCRLIRDALRYNIGGGALAGSGVTYDLVDCWLDWKGRRPAEIRKPLYEGVNFVTATEESFVFRDHAEPYDFIMSDGDHWRAQEWSGHVYERLLAPGGILIYHDVANTAVFPNLKQIHDEAIRNNWRHVLFDKSSRPDEACERGLLVIFKP
jgi:predicted O-methyltransferase YrrM